MYFLTDLERKLLLNKILPQAREVGVSPQLRGWNWHQPPLKPYYDDVKLPMYAVANRYCPTGRDIYLRFVEKEREKLNEKIGLGKIVHGAVSDALLSFIEGKQITFQEWTEKIRWGDIPAERNRALKVAEKIWSHVWSLCKARLEEAKASQPYASQHDLILSTVPFLIEHKISGELLGLSGLLSIDCYDYLSSIMYDLKYITDEYRDWFRLAPVGYALVFESVHEIPIDVCGVVTVKLLNGKIFVKKDLFFAGDELRSWWIEERDRKLEIVAEGRDPGTPKDNTCPEDCIYYHICYGG